MIWPPPQEAATNEGHVPKELPLREPLVTLLEPVLGVEGCGILNGISECVPESVFSGLRDSRATNLAGVLLVAAGQAPSESGSSLVPGRVDRGWLETFLEEASFASAELERTVWGRLLANELREPGTIYKRTIKFLAGMDLWELESFGEYSAFAFSFESGWRFMFEGETARRELLSYGRELDMGHHWVEIGLLGRASMTLDPRTLRGLRLSYQSLAWSMDSPQAMNAEPPSVICYRKFTAIGQQLASAMKIKSFKGYAKNVVRAYESMGVARFLPEDPPAASKS